MNTKVRAKPFVSIRIGAPESPKFREVRLSRLQFEIALILFPTAIIWGIISTTILVSNTNALRGESKATAAVSPSQSANVMGEPNGAMTSAPAPTALPKIQKPNTSAFRTNDRATPATTNSLSKASMTIDSRFVVTASIIGDNAKGSFKLRLTTSNLTDKLESGHFWINIRAVSTAGVDVWYSVSRNMTIDADGHSDTPKNGIRFSFRHTKTQLLPLYGPPIGIDKFAEMIVGFAGEDGHQVVGTAKL
jgi:hypothetical protein